MDYPRPPTAPASSAAAVTKSDSTVIAETRGLYIGGGGDVAVEFSNSAQAIFVGAVTGSTLHVCVHKVLSTGTTATSILALY